MAHEALSPAFRNLIDEHAPVRQLGSGFTFVEGPIWHPVEHYLLFSDMPADTRRRWDQAGTREVTTASNKGNGMTYDAELNLLVCEHATSSRGPHRPGRPARGPGLAFRGQGAQQPQRPLRALRRLDLFLRPVVRPHAGLWGRAATPARLAGRVPHQAGAGRGRSGTAGRPAPLHHAERALLLARREAPLHQRHASGQHPGVRRRAGTAACPTAGCSPRASATA